MIGYFLLQAFENALPGRQVVSLICQTEVAADDPAFEHPDQVRRPAIHRDEGQRLAAATRLADPTRRASLASGSRLTRADGHSRAPDHQDTASPAAPSSSVPAVAASRSSAARTGCSTGRKRSSTRTSAPRSSAAHLDADALLILTDVANVEVGFGTTAARPIGRTTPESLRAGEFPAGSMGPKVEAACRFVEATGKPAMIGSLDEAAELLARDTRHHHRAGGRRGLTPWRR